MHLESEMLGSGVGVVPMAESPDSGMDGWTEEAFEVTPGFHRPRSDSAEGMLAIRSQAEVAEILGIRQQTVARTEARALGKLRKALGQEYAAYRSDI